MSNQKCDNCQVLPCDLPEDLDLYAPQNWPNFLSPLLSFIVNCPVGYNCGPNFPRTITYPPGTWTIAIPPNPPAGYVIRLQGCLSLVTATIPTGATAAQIQAIANSVMRAVAQQQSQCDALTSAPPPQPIPAFFNQQVVFVKVCPEDRGLVVTGSIPSWITLDEENFRLIGAAGFFGGTTQAAANAAAQGAINFIGASVLSCETGFWNVEQTVTCPVGETGGPFTVPAHTYFSDIDQATADQEALDAAQAQADANCFDCMGNPSDLSLLTWGQVITSDSAFGNGSRSSAISASGASGSFNMTASVTAGISFSQATRTVVVSTTVCNPDFFAKDVKATFNINYTLNRNTIFEFSANGSQARITSVATYLFNNSGEGLSKSAVNELRVRTPQFVIPAHSNTVISFELNVTCLGPLDASATASFHMDGTWLIEYI